MAGKETIRLEVVYAKPAKQILADLQVPRGTTIAEAIALSGVPATYPDDSIETLEVAVWGKLKERHSVAQDGDRIEILRPLQIDPREFRRNLALDGKFMGSTDDSNDDES